MPGDKNDARREFYARRDAAARRVGAIDDRLSRARAERDERSIQRLEIDLNEAMAETRHWVEMAADVESEMEKDAARSSLRTDKPADDNRWLLYPAVLFGWIPGVVVGFIIGLFSGHLGLTTPLAGGIWAALVLLGVLVAASA
jgi:hypothetical protein